MGIPRPFTPRSYTADDLPELDILHKKLGLGEEWFHSKERLKIAMRDVKIPSSRRERRRRRRNQNRKKEQS